MTHIHNVSAGDSQLMSDNKEDCGQAIEPLK